METFAFGEDNELKSAYGHFQKMVKQERSIVLNTILGDIQQIKDGVTSLHVDTKELTVTAEQIKNNTSITARNLDQKKSKDSLSRFWFLVAQNGK